MKPAALWAMAALWPLLGLFPAPALALDELQASEIFMMLPDRECGGYTQAERQALLPTAFTAPEASGRSPAPDPAQPWVQLLSKTLMILHRPGFGDITYKLFNGHNLQLLAICRGRQRTAPIDNSCLFNLALFRYDHLGLTRVELRDYLPPISILDFVAKDTMIDPRAVKDLAALAPEYGQCLLCNASAHNPSGLDIVTATTVYASACNYFLPSFGLLPLTWNGQNFTKPSDRAAPPPRYEPER